MRVLWYNAKLGFARLNIRVRGRNGLMDALGAIGIWTCAGKEWLFRIAPPLKINVAVVISKPQESRGSYLEARGARCKMLFYAGLV